MSVSGDHFARIKVIGVGGGGSNAVNRMVETGVTGVDFVVANTDAQVLNMSSVKHKVQLGENLTGGLGAGGNPDVGLHAAEESRQDIRRILEDSDMVFITAGMGGGTGTGAAPIIAAMSRELGILTVAVVTKPFSFEGAQRERIAAAGIEKLQESADTIVTIPNNALLSAVDKNATLVDAFRLADDVLRQGVQGISDIITVPGMINVDFADVRAIMQNQGPALMGIGRGIGDRRSAQAAQAAISSPLLEYPITGATGILLNITGGPDLTLTEVNEAAEVVREAIDSDEANIIFGTVLDEKMSGEVRITVVATGFDTSKRRPEVAAAQRGEAVPRPEVQPTAPEVEEEEEEDLDVPAFLRKH